MTVVERFIETAPQTWSVDALLQPSGRAGAWRFREERDLEGWLIRPETTKAGVSGDALRLESSAGYVRLVRKVDLVGSAIATIELETESPLPAGAVRLFWASAGERFSPERSVRAESSAAASLQSAFHFEVTKHPAWGGRIERLRWDLPARPSSPVAVRRIETVPAPVDDEELAKARKVDLGGDVRNALLTPSGHAIERRLTLPPRAVLRGACGVPPGFSGSAHVRIVVTPAGDRGIVHLSKTLRPWLGAMHRWQEWEVDLSQHGGREVRIRLEAQAAENGDASLVAWAHPEILGRTQRARGSNVVLISIDTLRADHLSLYGYERPTSPRLDAWAKRRAVTFLNAVAPAPWTLPSHISMLTGLDALAHGANFNHPAPPSLRMLAEFLRTAGYQTAAFTGGGFLHPRYGLAQGFDRYHYWTDSLVHGELAGGTERALDWLERTPEPFFLFLHTYEVHSPYDRREPYYSRMGDAGTVGEFEARAVPPRQEEGFLHTNRLVQKGREQEPLSEEDRARVRQLYDSGIAYTDSHLGRLLEALRDSRLEERTVVVLTSDHGEALGERGLGGHAYLHDFNLMVPLVISAPGLERRGGTQVHQQVRLVDVVPTVLDLVGLGTPPGLTGVSLRPSFEGRPVAVPRDAWSYAASTNRGVSVRLSNRLKLVFNNTAWEPLRGREVLYDLVLDPAELAPRSSAGTDLEAVSEEIRQRLAAYPGGLHVRFSNPGDAPVRGRLRGHDLVHPTKVKVATPAPPGGLTWNQRGLASFELMPGASFDVFFESTGTEQLGIELEPGSHTVGFEGKYRAEALADPVYLVLESSDGGWRQAEGPPVSPAPFIELVWKGRESASEEPATEGPDKALREQLEALGYLD